MIREILGYPDKILKQKSQNVLEFDEKLWNLLDDMYETMIYKNGIGLAAIQIATALNVLIINLPEEDGSQKKEKLIEAINPKITHKEGVIVYTEGCLSVPEYYEDVERAERVNIEYFDRHGHLHIRECDGLLAIAFQHEMDHLQGTLFVERLSILKRKKFDKEWKKRAKEKR